MVVRKKGQLGRYKRRIRIRKKIFGNNQKPRLAVFRSLKNMQVQIVDDVEQKTLVAATTTSKEFKSQFRSGSNIKAAEKLGEILAKKAKAKGIEKIKFDRGGYMYHGRIKAFAEAARKNGLIF